MAIDKDDALSLDSVKDYFCELFEENKQNEIKIELIDRSKELTINYEGMYRITHTVDEWWYIFSGCSSMMLCSSEC